MVEATPAAAFVVAEADLLFQLLIIAFDAPAQFDGVDELVEGDVGRQGRKPILGRLVFGLGPLDDEPFLGAELGAQIVAMSRGCAMRPASASTMPMRSWRNSWWSSDGTRSNFWAIVCHILVVAG
jgi:hypothetical protein